MAKEEGIVKESDPDKMFKDMSNFADTEKNKSKLAKQKAKAPKVPFHPGVEKEITKPEMSLKEKKHEEHKKEHDAEKSKIEAERQKQEDDIKRLEEEKRRREEEARLQEEARKRNETIA
mmetsp:Transcript_22700/g.28078  ORF Transcript_22700/g.28078 Transcript_22700/m.28078 type:complete len:119 (+) Transcript_22700:159-515(+)